MSKKKISALFAIAAFSLSCVGEANAQGVTRINQPVMTPQQTNQWGESPQRQGRQGRKKRMLVMPGDVAKENVQKVTSEIHWNSNLNSALAQAKRQHKMVLWVHLVGNLSGAT